MPAAERVDGPLPGGTANRGRVIRVADTVRRPRGPYTAAVHALLDHLQRRGFDGAPRVIATAERHEVLGYIEGRAAYEPLPDWAATDHALAGVARLLRRYHEHASGFDAHGRTWQRPVPAAWTGPLVTHNDPNPANVVFRDGEAVALIDFDLAAPSRPAWDLALAACFWIPLRDEQDVSVANRGRHVERLLLFLDAYGADAALAAEVAVGLVEANAWITEIIRDNAARGHPAFGQLWEATMTLHDRADAWLAGHVDELRAALRDRGTP